MLQRISARTSWLKAWVEPWRPQRVRDGMGVGLASLEGDALAAKLAVFRKQEIDTITPASPMRMGVRNWLASPVSYTHLRAHET
mgnify:CR=1 FL=1